MAALFTVSVQLDITDPEDKLSEDLIESELEVLIRGPLAKWLKKYNATAEEDGIYVSEDLGADEYKDEEN